MGRMAELAAAIEQAERISDMSMKTQLTPDEKLRVAYAHIINGVDQHVLSALFGINPGRVNEAIMAVRRAIYDAPVPRKRGRPVGSKNKGVKK